MKKGRKTPFYAKHREFKGKIVDFQGWLLPVQFEGIIQEVLQTRQEAALFDVSHMGEILVEGDGTIDFLQRVLTNDIASMRKGWVTYSPVCNEDGGTVDDILVYCLDRQKCLLVVNGGNREKVYAWLQEKAGGYTVSVTDVSAEHAQLALQGPRSLEILLELTDSALNVKGLRYYGFLTNAKVGGVECLVSRTGYTGEDGFELYCSPQDASLLWDTIFEGARLCDAGLFPAGLGARDVLRLEAALPLYGNELTEEITPLEAGLVNFVSLRKSPTFIGQEALQKQEFSGLTKKMAGLIMLEKGVPRAGYPITAGTQQVGWISSGSYSPTLGQFIALAYLEPHKIREEDDFQVMIREMGKRARVVKTPFYRRERS